MIGGCRGRPYRSKIIVDFEFIEFMDGRHLYPSSLGFVYAFDNNNSIDLKKITTTFEDDGTRVVQYLNPYQGSMYTNPTKDTCQEIVTHNLYILKIRR